MLADFDDDEYEVQLEAESKNNHVKDRRHHHERQSSHKTSGSPNISDDDNFANDRDAQERNLDRKSHKKKRGSESRDQTSIPTPRSSAKGDNSLRHREKSASVSHSSSKKDKKDKKEKKHKKHKRRDRDQVTGDDSIEEAEPSSHRKKSSKHDKSAKKSSRGRKHRSKSSKTLSSDHCSDIDDKNSADNNDDEEDDDEDDASSVDSDVASKTKLTKSRKKESSKERHRHNKHRSGKTENDEDEESSPHSDSHSETAAVATVVSVEGSDGDFNDADTITEAKEAEIDTIQTVSTLAPIKWGKASSKNIVRKHVFMRGMMRRLTSTYSQISHSNQWVKRYFVLQLLVSQRKDNDELVAELQLAYAHDEDDYSLGLVCKTLTITNKSTLRLGFGAKCCLWITTGNTCWTLQSANVDFAMYWAIGLQAVARLTAESSTRLDWPYSNVRVPPNVETWMDEDPKLTSLRRIRTSDASSSQSQDSNQFIERGALDDATDVLFTKNFLRGKAMRLKQHLSLGSAWVKRFFSLDLVIGRGVDGSTVLQVELSYSETELDHSMSNLSRVFVIDDSVEMELACNSSPILFLRKTGDKPWVLKFEKVRQAMYWAAGIQKVSGVPLESFKTVQWPDGDIEEPMSLEEWLKTEEAAEVLADEGRLVEIISER